MNKTFYNLFLVLSLVSCSVFKPSALSNKLKPSDATFSYTDKNGQFELKLSSGFNKKKSFVTKRTLRIIDKEKENILEQSIALSEIGVLKKKNLILRPSKSQYSVWFDGKKYFTQIILKPKKKLFEVKLESPEKQWNGTSQIKIKNSKSLYCFFSQVIDCAKTIGFLSKAMKAKKGSLNMYVIWEGYPYLNEMYSNFTADIISKAVLEYDGKTDKGEQRFSLNVVGQSIFYIIDDDEQMEKMFWVSQGLSVVDKALGDETDNSIDSGGNFE